MKPSRDPAADPALLDLKRSAAAGTGRGPLYDRGVLAVVEQVERSGSFAPDPITLVDLVHFSRTTGANVVSAKEMTRAEHMARQRGWSWDEAAQYAAGVQLAETALAPYRRTDAGDDPRTQQLET